MASSICKLSFLVVVVVIGALGDDHEHDDDHGADNANDD